MPLTTTRRPQESANNDVNSNVSPTISDVPPHVLELIVHYLIGASSPDADLHKAHLRESIKNYLGFILFMYGALILVGVVFNVGVIVHIACNQLVKDPTYIFVINNALSDIVKCVFVLPISLYVLVVQNWTLGELLCSFLPMFQDIPLHVTTLTFILTAWDRYRFVRRPNCARFPAFVCVVGTWLTALCLVLPYPMYIIYVDLGKYSKIFDDIGFCVVNLTDDMQEYMRGIFLIMFAGPLATISYLYVKSSRELQSTSAIVLYESRYRETRSRTNSHTTSIEMRSRRESEIGSQHSHTNSFRENATRRPRLSNQQDNSEPEFDVMREKRTNKYLAMMVTMYAILMCPLMVLRVVRLALLETYENAGHFDITYTLFVWIAFLPTCTTPMLYISWHMSRPAKERLKSYFRFSNRKIQRSRDATETRYVSNAPPAALAGTTLNRSTPRYHYYNQQPNAQQHMAHPHYAHHESPPSPSPPPPPPPPQQHHSLAYYETQRQEEHHMMGILPDERDYAGYVYGPRSACRGNVLSDLD